jgi:hypothetical protein
MQKWVYEEIIQLDFAFAAKGLDFPCQSTDPTPVADLVAQKTCRSNLGPYRARGA